MLPKTLFQNRFSASMKHCVRGSSAWPVTFEGGDAIGRLPLIDQRVIEILKLSDQGIRERAGVAALEVLYARVTSEYFSVPPEQPEELLNYGFGIKPGVQAVLSYCISSYARRPSEILSQDPRGAALLSKIKPYPVLAGSAVLLGIDHCICDDVDLVQYIDVGTRLEERVNVAKKLRKLVEDLKPTTLKASLNNTIGNRPRPPRFAEGEQRIRNLLGMIVGPDPRNPNSQAISELAGAQLAWRASTFGVGKPVSLQLHFVHKAFVDKDVHPQQEVHECDAIAFLHVNQHWLAPSFRNYFQFLIRGIQSELATHDAIKASKRAAMLFGLVGNLRAQVEVISLLDNYLGLNDDEQRDSRAQIESIIDNLREALANACNTEEAK
jgi:hypothetical protein